MKKFYSKKTFALFAALLTIAALFANPVAAKEPEPDLSGGISPTQSWLLRPNEVWELPAGVTDLLISPMTGTVTVEIEKEKFEITKDTAVPADNADIKYRRIKPVSGEIYLWSTAAEYEIVGWAPSAGVAVVKTGPLGQSGPPPPGNVTPTLTPTLTLPEPTLTPVPPEPTPTPLPPEPTATLLPPTPVPPEPTVEPTVEAVSFMVGEDCRLYLIAGEEVTDLGMVCGEKGDKGDPGPGLKAADVANTLKADDGFVDSLRPEAIVDHKALAGILKADQAFVDSLRPPEAMIITPSGVVTDVGKYLVAHHAADLKGEEGPPGPAISDAFLRAILVAGILALVALGLGAWSIYYARGLPDCEWVNTAVQAMSTIVQTKIDTAVGVVKDMNQKISDCATADSVRRAITDLEQKIYVFRPEVDGLRKDIQNCATKTQMVEAIRTLQSQLESQIGTLAIKVGNLEEQVAPLAPRPAVESNGRLRCPGCNGFVSRIAGGLAGHCKRCGTAYITPAPEPVEVQEAPAQVEIEEAIEAN